MFVKCFLFLFFHEISSDELVVEILGELRTQFTCNNFLTF